MLAKITETLYINPNKVVQVEEIQRTTLKDGIPFKNPEVIITFDNSYQYLENTTIEEIVYKLNSEENIVVSNIVF